MTQKRKIVDIEKRLGFKWERGISRKVTESCQIPALKNLLNDIDRLKKEYVNYLPRRLRVSTEFAIRCEDLFHKYGPELWPEPKTTNRSEWLVDAENDNPQGEHYKKNLSYFDKDDRNELRDNFRDLVFEKCIRYHENQNQKQKRRADDELLETESRPWSAGSTAPRDVYTFDFDSDSNPAVSRTNSLRRGKYGFGTSAGIRSPIRPVAPVAQMTVAEKTSPPSPNDRASKERADHPYTDNFTDSQTSGVAPIRRSPTPVQTSPIYVSSGPTSPELGPGERTSSNRQPSGIFGRKHARSLSSDKEHPSKKRRKRSLVAKLKIDSAKLAAADAELKRKDNAAMLASDIQQPRRAQDETQTARKRPVSYAISAENDLVTNEARHSEAASRPSQAEDTNDRNTTLHNTSARNTTRASASEVVSEDPVDMRSIVADGGKPSWLDSCLRAERANGTVSEPPPQVEHHSGQRRWVESERLLWASPKSTNTAPISSNLPNVQSREALDPRSRTQEPMDIDKDQPILAGSWKEDVAPTSGLTSILRADCERQSRDKAPQQSSSEDTFSFNEQASRSLSERPGVPALPTTRSKFTAINHGDTGQFPRSSSAETFIERNMPAAKTSPALQAERGIFSYYLARSTHLKNGSEHSPIIHPEQLMSREGSEGQQHIATEDQEPNSTKSDDRTRPIMKTDTEERKADLQAQSNAKADIPTALERARTAVYWDRDSDCPHYIPLNQCKTHEDLFAQLRRRLPKDYEQKAIRSIEVRLTNLEATGITENPNCTIEANDDNEPFDNLVSILGECTANVRPKLRITVQFMD